MMNRVVVIGMALALSAAFPINTAAQQSIPAELATALASAGGLSGDGDPMILVGALPSTLRLNIPRNGTLLGTATQGRAATAIVVFRSSVDSAIATLTDAVLASGWRLQRRQQNNYGGFQPARTGTNSPSTMNTSPIFCGDSAMVTFRAARRRSDSVWIAVRVTPVLPPPMYNECSARPTMGQMAQTTQPPLPTLFNPATVLNDNMSACFRAEYGGASNEFEQAMINSTRTSLRTGMSPDAIADHYAKQLQDSGWAPSGLAPLLAPPAMRTWTRRDSTGLKQITLIVSAVPRDSSCRAVSLDIRPAKAP